MKEKGAHNIDWELIAKDVSGELTAEEHEQLNKRLVEEKDLIGQMSMLWGDTKYAQEVKAINTDKAWSKVKQNMTSNNTSNQQKLRVTWRRVMSVAAMLVLLLSSYLIIKMFVPQNGTTNVVASSSIKQVMLNDGSVVDLNIGSSLEYPQVFDSESRIVKLNGEAFFDVARDEAKPFLIQTNQLQIRVLGTSFNVKANSLNGNEVVTVRSGKVVVTHGDDRVVLIKGEVADYDAKTNRLIKHGSNNKNYIAWKTKEIEFDNTGLLDVLSTIENVYNITIEMDDTVVADSLVINADFSHDDLNHVLETVCNSFNLSYKEVANKYQITKVQ